MTKIYSAFGLVDSRGIGTAPCVIVGGTPLLQHFFTEISHFRNCNELWICSPFVDGDAKSLLTNVATIANNNIALNFITSDEGALRTAWKALTPLPWRDFTFGIYRGWHAKIYLALDKSHGRVCLTGSHNFTEAGAAKNFEAGTLFISYGQDDIADVVFDIRATLEKALQDSSAIYSRTSPLHPGE